MKIEKVRDMADDELANRIDEIKEEIFRARLQDATGQLDRPAKIRGLRRDLARMKTILREREVEAKSTAT
jgi:large subunit ribosomal protein L29